MAEWIGIEGEGEHERTIINTKNIMFIIAGNNRHEIDIYFVNGSVKTFKVDYESMLQNLKQLTRREE